MVDLQGVNVLKDIVVPIALALIGAAAVLIGGYFTIAMPQRDQRKRESAAARFAISAFFEVAHLAGSTIIALPGQPLGEMETVLRERIIDFLHTIPKFAFQLIPLLQEPGGDKAFHLMIIELDRRRLLTNLTDADVLFAYGAAATTGLLLGTSDPDSCTRILAAIVRGGRYQEPTDFFGVVVDRVLPLRRRQEVQRQISA